MKLALIILSSLIFSSSFACTQYEALIIADVNSVTQQDNGCVVTVKALKYYSPSILCAFNAEARLFSEGVLLRDASCEEIGEQVSGVIIERSENYPLELEY